MEGRMESQQSNALQNCWPGCRSGNELMRLCGSLGGGRAVLASELAGWLVGWLAGWWSGEDVANQVAGGRWARVFAPSYWAPRKHDITAPVSTTSHQSRALQSIAVQCSAVPVWRTGRGGSDSQVECQLDARLQGSVSRTSVP